MDSGIDIVAYSFKTGCEARTVKQKPRYFFTDAQPLFGTVDIGVDNPVNTFNSGKF